MTLILLQQANLLAAPQARHASLLEGSPQRLPALAGCVAPPVDLLPLLAELCQAAIPFGFQQPFHGSSQLLQELVPHLIPTLLHHNSRHSEEKGGELNGT